MSRRAVDPPDMGRQNRNPPAGTVEDGDGARSDREPRGVPVSAGAHDEQGVTPRLLRALMGWEALRHGGNLLSPEALEHLPAPQPAPRGLADRLRAALVAFDPDTRVPRALGALLDTVLEDVCGLRTGWQKGSGVDKDAAVTLLDGTVLKPRRRWTGPEGDTLVVFTTDAPRVGTGRGNRPFARALEYLRRSGIPLGLLTNGTQWRLLWADADSQAWVEWEAERWLEADQVSSELEALRLVLSPVTLNRRGQALGPLLAAIRDTRRGLALLSKELGERVRRAAQRLWAR